MDLIDKILGFLGPTAFIGAILTYWFGIRQKRYELNQEHYKKIRVTVSELLSIWNEYASLERFIKSDDPTNFAIYHVSELAEKFFKIDQKKLKRMNKAFLLSIENLKEIDIVLFHKLNGSLDNFNESNSKIFLPLIQSEINNDETRREIIIPILDELLESIEDIILDTIKHLPNKEKKNVKRVLNKHLQEVKKHEKNGAIESEVPGFLVNLINNTLAPKILFEPDDFRKFYQNETIQWIIIKLMNIPYINKILFADVSGINLLFSLLSGNEKKIESKISNFDFNQLQFSKEDSKIFINNKEFYHIVLGMIQKIEGTVPMFIKRELVKLNNGEILLHQHLNLSADMVDKL